MPYCIEDERIIQGFKKMKPSENINISIQKKKSKKIKEEKSK